MPYLHVNVFAVLLAAAAAFGLGALWYSPILFAKQWMARAVFLAVVVFGVSRVARLNLLGYFLVLAIPGLLLGAVELLSQPNAFYRQQGAICLGALAVLWLASGRPAGAESSVAAATRTVLTRLGAARS